MADAVSLNQQLVELRTLKEERSYILEKTVAKGRHGRHRRVRWRPKRRNAPLSLDVSHNPG